MPHVVVVVGWSPLLEFELLGGGGGIVIELLIVCMSWYGDHHGGFGSLLTLH